MEKKLKKKLLRLFLIPAAGFFIIFFLLLTVILMADDEEIEKKIDSITGLNLSSEVLAYKDTVASYAAKYGIEDYVNVLLAIMQVESGGLVDDVMQSSESAGFPPNTLKPVESIEQGVKYFAGLLKKAEEKKCDLDTVIQSYNYGGGFIDYVAKNDKKYTYSLAEAFAKEKSGGKKVDYYENIAVNMNGGWRYKYGNMFYVLVVKKYLYVSALDNSVVDTIMGEALRYQGTKYVWGGSSPETGFDCSGLTQWCYGVAGITLPRTAQEQYNATQHIPIEDALPGDLVFFQGTYDTDNYITHVGIYVGDMKMYHAGDPIGYADINSEFFSKHLVCAGRMPEL